jgi:hypothetical protein
MSLDATALARKTAVEAVLAGARDRVVLRPCA